jgi:hypothetical protein
MWLSPDHYCAGSASGLPARHRSAEFRAASRPAAPVESAKLEKAGRILAGVDWDALALDLRRSTRFLPQRATRRTCRCTGIDRRARSAVIRYSCVPGVLALRGDMDWERDDSLVARIESLDWRQRYQTAVMALRRLRVPLMEFGMPADWGVPLDLVRSLFVTLTAEPGDALADAVHTGIDELQMAPLLADREYVDPDLIQEVQLEAIGCLLMLNHGLMDLDVDSTEDIA